MLNNKLVSGLTFLIILALIFSINTENLKAENISFSKAIEIGLENSSKIKEVKNDIESLKRTIEGIKAQKDWEINLDGNYTHEFEEDESSKNTNSLENDSTQDSISILASKSCDFGLSFNPSLTVAEDNENLSLSLTQQLYPITESNLENQLFNNEKELIKAEDEFKNLKSSKIISWIESYLNIVRMEERKEIYLKSVNKAEENLAKVKNEKEIGEAGEQQLLTAKYSLEDAKYKLKEYRYNLEETKKSFKNQLGISQDKKIDFNSNNKLIVNLKDKTKQLVSEYLDNENLLKLVEKSNSTLQANKIDRKNLERELKNLKKEDDLNIKITGDYDTLSENLTATVNFSYNLYDGGKHEIDLESKRESIRKNINNYEDKLKQLKLDLENHFNKLSLDKDKLLKEELNYERSKNDLKIAEKKYNRGAIDYLEYQDSWIKTKEVEINLKSIKDSIFINKLKFVDFVNAENIIGGF